MSDLCSQLDAYLARGLAPEAAAVFEAHAQTCQRCGPAIATWRSFGAALSTQLSAERRAPTRIETANLLAAASDDSPRRTRWLLPAVAAVTASVVALVGWRVTASSSQPMTWSVAVVASQSLTARGDSYSTAATGRAVLQLGEDSLGLGEATSVSVKKASPRETRLTLEKGSLAAKVDPARGRRDFTVETSMGTVHVVGTVFRVRAVEPLLQVDVIEGVVEVVARDGSKARIRAGQQVRVRNGALQQPEAFGATSYDEFSAQLPAVVVDEDEPREVDVDAGTLSVAARPVKKLRSSIDWRGEAAREGCPAAMKEAEKFVSTDSSDPDAWLMLGDCRRQQGLAQAAAEAYVAASKTKSPRGRTGLLQAAELFQKELNQPAKAVELVDTFLKTKPDRRLEAAALLRKAQALISLNDPVRAQTVLDDITARLPETPSAVEALRLKARLSTP